MTLSVNIDYTAHLHGPQIAALHTYKYPSMAYANDSRRCTTSLTEPRPDNVHLIIFLVLDVDGRIVTELQFLGDWLFCPLLDLRIVVAHVINSTL